jgi:hypothetical protein
LASRHGTPHDPQSLTAGWTGLTRAEGWAPGLRGVWRWFRSRGRGNSWASRQAELKLVQARAMDRPPPSIGADFVEALGQHLVEDAADERIGG